MDTVTRERRSEIMRGIQGNELKPEATMHRALRSKGLRPRRNPKDVPGKPDFWWPRRRVAVFVDGCFWHGCPWHWKLPKSNGAFWAAKIEANLARDRRATEALEQQGVTVVRVWECSLLQSPRWWAAWIAQAVASSQEAVLVLKMAWKQPISSQKRLENSSWSPPEACPAPAGAAAGGQNGAADRSMAPGRAAGGGHGHR